MLAAGVGSVALASAVTFDVPQGARALAEETSARVSHAAHEIVVGVARVTRTAQASMPRFDLGGDISYSRTAHTAQAPTPIDSLVSGQVASADNGVFGSWIGGLLCRVFGNCTETTVEDAPRQAQNFQNSTIQQTPPAPTSTVRQQSATTTTPNDKLTGQVVNQYVTQPVIERTIERGTPTVAGVDEATLNSKLSILKNDLLSRIAQSSGGGGGYTPVYVNSPSGNFVPRDLFDRQVDAIWNGVALSNRIDSLSDITVDGVSGLTDADIPNGITASNYLPLAGGALTGALTNSATATSTFSGPLAASVLNISTTTATSTFASGINLSGGCFSVNGTCITGGGGGGVSLSAANTWTALQLFSAGASTTNLSSFGTAYFGGTSTTTIGSTGSITLPSAALLTAPYASSTALSVSGTGYFGTASTTNLTVSGAPGGILKTSSSGAASVATAGTDYENALTFSYPFSRSSNTVSLAFGTTTSNIWAGTQTFTNAPAFSSLTSGLVAVGTNGASYTVATSTNFVTSLSGTTNQIDVSAATGDITLSLPALVSLTQASTTRLSVFDRLYVGGTATSTIFGNATSTFGAGIESTYLNITGTAATSTFANGIKFTGGCIEVGGTCIGGSSSQWTTSGSNIYFNTGSVLIGTTTAGRTLTVFNTAANAQQRISYDATRYSEFYVDASGDLQLTATGKNLRALDANLYLCDGGACPTTPVQGYPSFTSQGNAVLAGTIYTTGIAPVTCPTGMIPVPPMPEVGLYHGFCVDKYEAQSSGGNEVSAQGGSPWVSITQYDAISQCRRAGKHLITEPEWMAIARNVEDVGWNWNGGVAGTNNMSDGHSDGSPASALATAADSDPCNGTGQTCSTSTWDSQRRTYQLSNGEYIWDFAGNVWEWVDQANQEDYPVANSGAAGWQACSTSGDGVCGNTRTTNDQWYRGASTALRGFIRGGNWNLGASGGAFTLHLGNAPGGTGTDLGFRCAR